MEKNCFYFRIDSFWLTIWNLIYFFYTNSPMVGQVGHLNTHGEDLERREVTALPSPDA